MFQQLKSSWIVRASFFATLLLPSITTGAVKPVDVQVEVERFAALPDEKIDVGLAALTFAKEVYPNIDVGEYSAKIDRMVADVKRFTKGSTDPDWRIRVLNTYLFKDWGLRYDFNDYRPKSDIRNLFLNNILDRKKGTCASMPLLYLVIAQRLGYPVRASLAPSHMFLRYVDKSLKRQNLEATSGASIPDEGYAREFHINEAGIKSGTYLRTLSNRELIGDLLLDNASYWAEKHDLSRALHLLYTAEQLLPGNAEVQHHIGVTYRAFAKDAAADAGLVLKDQDEDDILRPGS